MKDSKRYLVFGVMLVAALLVKFGVYAGNARSVDEFRGANLEASVWNPLIAANVNDNLLSVVIDNKEYTNENYRFFMDDNLNIMAPVEVLRDALNCSAHVYGGKKLLVEKHSSQIEFLLKDKTAVVDGRPQDIVSPFSEIDGEYYVSLNDLANYLDYSYSWDMENNAAQAADNSESVSVIPARYDLRERGRTTNVRNQGLYGTCWAFAALGALESSLMPEEKAEYSAEHMTHWNGFNLTEYDGGDYSMAMAYLAAWRGPVFESDDPYGDGESDGNLAAVKHVQEIQIIDGKDYEKIKEAVFKYGGVQTSIYSSMVSAGSASADYNRNTNAYCYIGTEKPNHAVVIIGWDDGYPKENFSVDLEGDGAFICQNSWGKNFGEDGVFYVSYYDTNVGTHNVAYTRVEDVGNYDSIYQSDLCGWVGNLGYRKNSAYGANVYTAAGQEVLEAVSFYATGKDSQYAIYVVRDFEDEKSFEAMIPVASGKLSNAGYYTVKCDNKILLEEGERFAVVLYINTPNEELPIAMEYRADEVTETVILEDGESYVSPNGFSWDKAEVFGECNLCIKAFTNQR